SFYISQNNYILKFLSLAGWKVYTVDGNSQRIIRVETFNKNSNTLIRREVYEYAHNNNGTWEPTTTVIFLPQEKTQVEISFSTVAFNLPLEGLTIAYPDDAERVTIQ
ncbi:MAG: hypothetical protein PHP42_13585, partial [Bacteroidota bacterium]|nr:hypothetical protein [Bacteroidota bacterium]